ncbi:MAG TPA: CsbD family protein [Lacisediminihabitans sp.]|uniref:CsbD family protein n=1 Tax=Lacisediminihabitans sp. TaxID=2787631 RepID=UPI002ED80611
MSAEDKIKNGAEKLIGQAKAAAGHIANNDRLVAEGKVDQAKADVKGTVEDVKDTFKK